MKRALRTAALVLALMLPPGLTFAYAQGVRARRAESCANQQATADSINAIVNYVEAASLANPDNAAPATQAAIHRFYDKLPRPNGCDS